MNQPASDTPPNATAAAKALLAFWRAAGVDMDEAEAVYAAAPARAAAPPPRTAGFPPATAALAGETPAVQAAPRATVRRAKTQESPIDDARALATKAMSIAELRTAVEGFSGCGLKQTARTTVFSDGVEHARVLLIGEAPGKEEDEQGKPFVGRSGQLLDRMLKSIGLDRRENLFISNCIFWRPPGNRPPTQGEIAMCLPFAERLIELVNPSLLLLAGGVAAQTVLKREDGVMRMRGRRLLYNREGLALPVNAMVMLHPAYLLRRPQEKRLAWADLLQLETWLDELGAARGQYL